MLEYRYDMVFIAILQYQHTVNLKYSKINYICKKDTASSIISFPKQTIIAKDIIKV